MAVPIAYVGAAQHQPELSGKPKRTIKPTTAYDGSKPSYTGVSEGNQAFGQADEDDENRRVTVWNPKTGKKLSGNAGVFKRNLARYLRTHPDWIVWTGQDKEAFRRKRSAYAAQEHSPKRRRVDGYDYQSDNKRRAIEGLAEEMPTAASLWRSLLAVCSEKSILAEVDRMESEEDSEPEPGYPRDTTGHRYGPNVSPYKSHFSPGMHHGGLMSPAVG